MTRSQLNLALLLLAGGLAAAVILSQEKKEKAAPLTTLSADSITKVRIEHPGSPALVLEKAGGAWKLLEPVQTPADGIEMNGVLGLASLEVKSTLDLADLKAADLGLEPPQYSVQLNDQKIEVGLTDPLQYQRYLRTGGKVVLTEDPPSTALDADYSDLVSKQLLPEGAEIVRIQMPGLAIARDAEGKGWQLQPAQEASADQKQKLIDGWKGARAMWNAAQLEGELKGDTITVELKGGTILKFLVAEIEPQLVLVRPDLKVRYTLSKALVDEILKLPAEEKKDEKAVAAPAAAAPATAQ